MRVRGQSSEVKTDAWADLVVREFEERVRATAASFEALDLAAPPVAEVVGLVTAVLPKAAPHALDAEVGPFYDTASVMTLLGGVSKQAVDARRRNHTILALKTSDERWVYPVFQFAGRDVNPSLVPAIRACRDAPAWSAALWFVTKNPDLDDLTPLEWARSERPVDALTLSARRTAYEWR
jgi:hypothetical protein